MNNDTKILKALMKKLQSLDENTFSREILVDLFRMEYPAVEFYGGPYEGGKDLICWRKSRLGDVELAVVQVKRINLSAASSSQSSFGDLINQLHQAREKLVPHPEGYDRRPNKIIFVTPFPVATRALESRIEGYRNLMELGVRIIDGNTIAKLVIDNLPDVADRLLGKDTRINSLNSRHLNNADLLRALGYGSEQNVASYYFDLHFGVGKINTSFFFQIELKARKAKVPLRLENSEWMRLKDCAGIVLRDLGVPLFSSNIHELENGFRRDLNTFHRRLDPKLSDIKKGMVKVAARIKRKIKHLISLNHSSDEIALLIYANESMLVLAGGVGNLTFSDLLEPDTLREQIEGAELLRQQLRDAEMKANQVCDNLGASNDDGLTILRELRGVRDALKSIKYPSYKVEILAASIVDLIIARRDWIERQVAKFGSTRPSANELRNFLTECWKVFNASGSLFAINSVRKAIGYKLEQRFVVNSKLPSPKISIHDVFACGVNIAVLGEAGSGKTTSLQSFASASLRQIDTRDMVLFIPLSRCGVPTAFQRMAGLSPSERSWLPHLIVHYLGGVGIDITSEELMVMMAEKKTTLLLDGIDEVGVAVSWLSDQILKFVKEQPNVVVVASCRTVGNLLEDLGFLGVTLLPFNKEQRSRFIIEWFKRGEKSRASRVLEHLQSNPEVASISTNPLLATTLCVLAENDVPLPNSEIRLYEERMHLLLGQYDLFKGVKRLESQQWLLLRVAQKVAFLLHKNNLRSASMKMIVDGVLTKISENDSELNLRKAIYELLDPCNMLVPMTEEGDLGFGHLRYQEFLVAKELHTNRSIKIVPLIKDSWWKGSLVLFAKMADDFSFLINNLSDFGDQALENDTVLAMFAVRPAIEFAKLNRNITMRNRLQKHPGILDIKAFDLNKKRGEDEFFDYDALANYLAEFGNDPTFIDLDSFHEDIELIPIDSLADDDEDLQRGLGMLGGLI